MLLEKMEQLNPYEKLYNRNLSENEMAEIKHNLLGYLKLLIEVDKQQKKKSKILFIERSEDE